MKILYAASECSPFIKTGGLGDVAGALPKYLKKAGADVRVILPFYSCTKTIRKNDLKLVKSFEMKLSWRRLYVGILEYELDDVTYYFVDNEDFFTGDMPYDGSEHDLEKFAFFSKAILECLPKIGFKPDVINCNDWQSALVPVFLKEMYNDDDFYAEIKTIFTIHNLRFQGRYNMDKVKDFTGLADDVFSIDKLEYYGDANLLKGALVYADRITTVSESYALEIMTPFYGEGLDAVLQGRSYDVYGIVNGIDYGVYSPDDDEYIQKKYNVTNFRREKVKNKTALQTELGLAKDPKKIMIGLISRLTDQKGIDLIAYMMEELCAEELQLVVLGTGDPRYEEMFRYYAQQHPEKISANILYSEELSHKIYAGCDAFLMPSLFEPCGLSQLMSMRYGTVPVVRETGGLKDTVAAYNEYEHTGTGFSFANFNAHEMMGTIRYAERIYYTNKREWNRIAERCMNADYSWDASAEKYMALYESLTKKYE